MYRLYVNRMGSISRIQTGIIIVLCIILIWTWYINFRHPKIEKQFIYDTQFKTGDLILFHGKNLRSTIIFTYWTHIGIVYIDPDDPEQIPYLFEAASVTRERDEILPTKFNNGIMLNALLPRLERYSGYIAVKSLDRPIKDDIARGFRGFISYAQKNMRYGWHSAKSQIKNCFKKKLGYPYTTNTHCAELVLLSLIKLGLFPMSELNKKVFHSLRKVQNNIKLVDNFYHKPIGLLVNKFG